jgi:hypothetical protein
MSIAPERPACYRKLAMRRGVALNAVPGLLLPLVAMATVVVI